MAIKFHTCERKSRYIFMVAEKYPDLKTVDAVQIAAAFV